MQAYIFPGGKACYPSSVLMNVIPAQVAGVNKITLFSPPVAPGNVADIVMAVAYLCGVDQIIALGGAQAVAAMAYGTNTIDKVDVIAGPGNAYVAEAKRQVQGLVGIDSIAGPTEVMVMAGKSANPAWIAADLLAQAEHDQEAMSILMSPDLELLKAVEAEVDKQLAKLPKQDIARVSLWNKGVFIQIESFEDGVELANSYGPEHMEVVAEAEDYAFDITGAGALFIGEYSCEALGDYVAGPNHVLPTMGSARFSSPLGVSHFKKAQSIIHLNKASAQKLCSATSILANAEGLVGHARSAEMRMDA